MALGLESGVVRARTGVGVEPSNCLASSPQRRSQYHGNSPVNVMAYLGTGHFGEATFENWESEFLQMAFYVLLTIYLYQVVPRILRTARHDRPRAIQRGAHRAWRRRRDDREYIGSSQFWFESFQNWQSEFLSLAAMVSFTIYLRQRGSPESKPVDAPTWETGK